jgi:hypothetical protein
MIDKKQLRKVHKQDAQLAKEIMATLGYKISAKDADNRTVLMIKSEEPGQKLTGIKKILEATVASLVSKAKAAEDYDRVDELEKTRDRIILHLNSLKKMAK